MLIKERYEVEMSVPRMRQLIKIFHDDKELLKSELMNYALEDSEPQELQLVENVSDLDGCTGCYVKKCYGFHMSYYEISVIVYGEATFDENDNSIYWNSGNYDWQEYFDDECIERLLDDFGYGTDDEEEEE